MNNRYMHALPLNFLLARLFVYFLEKFMFILPEIDECEEPQTNNCEQICVNVPGSFFCDCHDGYKLSANKHNCKGNKP